MASSNHPRQTNWEGHLKKEKAMPRCGKIGQLIVFIPEDGGKVIHAYLPPPDLQHGPHQSADHSPEEPVGFYPVNQAAVLLQPAALINGADKGLRLGVPFGKRGEIRAFGNKGCGGLHFLLVKGIGEIIRPVNQEGVFFPVNIIPVLPAESIETTMGIGSHGIKILKNDIPGKEGIDIIKGSGLYSSFKINMKEILQGVDAPVRPGGSRQCQPLPEENGQRLFHFLLDGSSIVLDLESTVIRAFIGNFQEISGHRTGMAAFWSAPAKIAGLLGYGWVGRLLPGHRLELAVIDRIGQRSPQFPEMVIRGKGIGGLEEPELKRIGRKDLAQGPDLPGAEAF
jgi:hypothetical protein